MLTDDDLNTEMFTREPKYFALWIFKRNNFFFKQINGIFTWNPDTV